MSEAIEARQARALSLGKEGYVSGMAWASVDATIQYLLDQTAANQALADRNGTERRAHEDLRAVREGLEGTSPTPLERLMVERVLVCYAAIAALECTPDSHPAGATDAGWKRTERLHRRFNEACKALATVQRMRLPASPVYVGGQHVHLGE